MRRAICILVTANLFLAMLSACGRQVYYEARPQTQTTAGLYQPVDGWPEDESTGLSATGASRPTTTVTEKEDLLAKAEDGALRRIFSLLRSQGIPASIGEETFYACVGEVVPTAYVKKEVFEHNRVEVSVFIEQQFVDALKKCFETSVELGY
ncbi:MAG: hypothetical protein GF398_10270 [Chitinivibrionales bacterium]|nr:hypothetical protein [Chitinivibrionales bacterium]